MMATWKNAYNPKKNFQPNFKKLFYIKLLNWRHIPIERDIPEWEVQEAIETTCQYENFV